MFGLWTFRCKFCSGKLPRNMFSLEVFQSSTTWCSNINKKPCLMPIAVCWQLRCLLTDGYYGFKMDLFAAGLTGWNSFLKIWKLNIPWIRSFGVGTYWNMLKSFGPWIVLKVWFYKLAASRRMRLVWDCGLAPWPFWRSPSVGKGN